MDPFAAILIFIAVIAVTAVLFGAWLIASIVSLVCRALIAPFRAANRRHEAPMLTTTTVASTTGQCPNDHCRAENPAVALFCRRCGSPMRPAQRVPVRRVAMW